MPFKWSCPICEGVNFYNGSKTTNVVVKCKICGKRNVKASSHKIIEKKKEEIVRKTTGILPKTTKTLPRATNLNFNGSLESLLIMSNYAINTIKNKKQVKEKDLDSTWYQHYLSWTKWRKTFQMALEERK